MKLFQELIIFEKALVYLLWTICFQEAFYTI